MGVRMMAAIFLGVGVALFALGALSSWGFLVGPLPLLLRAACLGTGSALVYLALKGGR